METSTPIVVEGMKGVVSMLHYWWSKVRTIGDHPLVADRLERCCSQCSTILVRSIGDILQVV